MLVVAPARPVGLDVGFGALIERHRLRRIEPRLHALRAPRLDRVYSFVPKFPGVQRLRAGFREAIEREWSQAHLPRASGDHVAVNPGSAVVAHLQIKPAAIGIHAGLLRPFDLKCRKSTRCPCHALAVQAPTIVPTIALRIMTKDGERVKTVRCAKKGRLWAFVNVSEGWRMTAN